MKQKISKFFAPVFLFFFFITLVIDQITKWFALRILDDREIVIWEKVFRFRLFRNNGIAFGLVTEKVMVYALIIGAFLFLIWMFIQHIRKKTSLSFIALSLVIGGAIGNIIDRVRFGYVIDFIDIMFWSIFNFADIAICVGVGILVYIVMVEDTAVSAPRMKTKSP